MEKKQVVKLIAQLVEDGYITTPLVVWDVFRGQVDEHTVALCLEDEYEYALFDLVRAVAGWNIERLPEKGQVELMVLLEDLYQEVIDDDDGKWD